jgi:hypothetical protein
MCTFFNYVEYIITINKWLNIQRRNELWVIAVDAAVVDVADAATITVLIIVVDLIMVLIGGLYYFSSKID